MDRAGFALKPKEAGMGTGQFRWVDELPAEVRHICLDFPILKIVYANNYGE
jgi:hypothetical protein